MRQLAEASMEQMDVVFKKNHEADKALYVIFNLEPHPSAEKSKAEGRPIFEEREYIMIMVPGDKDSIVHRPISEMDIARFSDRYESWKNKVGGDRQEGTPLKMVPWLNSAQVKELEFFNCYTLEQLAAMSDTNAQKFMGMHSLRQRAKDAVQSAKDAAPLMTMRADMEAKDMELKAAHQAIAELAARLTALENQPEVGKSKIK